jgi:hypothetical protein
MATVNKRIQKKRGRPKKPGGPSTSVPARLPKPLLAGLDDWAKRNGKASRSAAIRSMIEIVLGKGSQKS